tara:strand:- start:211 stop:507 length:297 start_codon:yes stop_codon:yes gene_type:complete
MAKGIFNITTATTTTLVELGQDKGVVRSISVCNNHATLGSKVSIYLDDGTNQTYFTNQLALPGTVTLFLNEGLSFNNAVFALKITNTGSGLPLSVILK